MNELSLKSQHIVLPHAVAETHLAGETHVLLKFDGEEKKLLLAPATNAHFKQQHKASLHMLKEKNLKGDKSVSIQEIVIDHDIDDQDRIIAFSVHEGFIKIDL